MSKKLKVGVIGCGNISTTYFKLAPLFNTIEIIACADLNMTLAETRAKEFSVAAVPPSDLLELPEIDIVLNLTVPAAHVAVTSAAVKAGKHVYSEKPLALSLKDGLALKKLAAAKRVKIGSAPDTILGGSHQRARKAIDDGLVGRITAGTAAVLSHGMESWHPNPDFFFKPGGGPVLDMGPYYIANLVNLLGPVKRVGALSSMAEKHRIITSQPRAGEKITVKTPTNIQALLEFASGATVTLLASWDVWANRQPHMDLYGTEGSLYLPDPNFFGGTVLASKRGSKPEPLPEWKHPFGVNNQKDHNGDGIANYRALGLADLADAIMKRRDPRCSLDRALHAVEIMTAILKSGETGRFVTLKTRCTRAAPLTPEDAQALLA